MERSLYNSRIGRVVVFVKRFGITQVFMKPLRMVFAPLIIKLKTRRNFNFNGKVWPYFYHSYNTTWINERQIEIPIIISYLKQTKGKVLEIGRVMPHYFNTQWDVLDKFEKGKNVINEDIASFSPKEKYDFIFSISTFEHIGFDDGSKMPSGEKIIDSYKSVCQKCLNKKGAMIMTIPIGYNPHMDKLIAQNKFNFNKETCLKRIKKDSWIEVSKEEALKTRYGKPFPYANALFVGEYRKK
ncbi:MAG: hypothetical protein Q8Q31_03120 [Nanoarchaeota archaeon]|nr:hypothetical protein [Nanoarchaeota archaeon]